MTACRPSGPIRPAYVTRAIEDAMPAGSGTVTTVAIGADSDIDTLGAMARGGGGVMLPFVPGQTTAEAVFAPSTDGSRWASSSSSTTSCRR